MAAGSDIDLVLTVQTGQADVALAKTGKAVQGVTGSASAGSKAFGVFNTQLNQGSIAAGLSAAGFSQMGQALSALPVLLNPITVGLAAVSFTLYKIYEVSQQQKELDEAAHLREVASAAHVGAAGWNAYYQAIAGGLSRVEASQAKQRAEERTAFEEGKKNLDVEIARLEAKNEALKKIIQTGVAMGEFTNEEGIARAMIVLENEAAIKRMRQEIEDSADAEGRTVRHLEEQKRLRLELLEMVNNVPRQFTGTEFAPDDPFRIGAGMGSRVDSDLDLFNDGMMSADEMPAGLAVTDGWSQEQSDMLAATLAFKDGVAEAYEEIRFLAEDAIGGSVVGAFDAYAEALDRTVSLNALFAGGFDKAMRNMAASVLRSVGQQAAVKAAFELAESVRALANYDYNSAAQHGRAAAMYAGVALVAGAAAGATSVSAGSGARSGGGGYSEDREGMDGRSRTTNHITIIGNMDTATREDLLRQLQEAADGRDL